MAQRAQTAQQQHGQPETAVVTSTSATSSKPVNGVSTRSRAATTRTAATAAIDGH